MSERNRCVVTGLGVVAPNGLGLEPYWKATQSGRSGLRPLRHVEPNGCANTDTNGGDDVDADIDADGDANGDMNGGTNGASHGRPHPYPVHVAGRVVGFAARGTVPARLIPQTDRVTQFSLAATEEAIGDAGLDLSAVDDYAVGVITSLAFGGFEYGQREQQNLWSQGPQAVSPYQSFAWFYAVNTGQISIRYKLRGHSSVVVTEQAGGLDALAHARRLLRDGTLRAAIAGGMEAPLCPWALAGQIASGRLSGERDPRRAYLPFDRGACGHVPGEGGAMLVVESAASAGERGAARCYGEIAGYAATFDPYAGSGRPGTLPRALRGALADAELEPYEVDAVLADACGLRDLDAAEARAITEVFGVRKVPVSVPKALTGRLYAGGGPLDVAGALMMIRDGVVPAVPYPAKVPADYGIDLVMGESRQTEIRNVLVIARGHGGFNSALVVCGG